VRVRIIIFIIPGAVVITVAAIMCLYSQGQYVSEINITQPTRADALELNARTLEDVKNESAAQMNLAPLENRLDLNCQTDEERNEDLNPIILKRGDDEFQKIQFCVYSTETYYRKMYIVAEPAPSPQNDIMTGMGLTVNIEPQVLEIPAWQDPRLGPDSYKQLIQLMAYEKIIDVYVKADAKTQPGRHHFTVAFTEPSEYREPESTGLHSHSKVVYVEVRP
jgi:hypothetical protein